MSSGNYRRVGILGGSFDPVHVGHLRAAIEAREALGLDLILFVPAGRPPHKNLSCSAASLKDRMAMLEAAVKPWDWMKIFSYEVKKKGVSYTADTLKAVRSHFGSQVEYFLLVGSDWKDRIRTWKDYAFIAGHCRIVWFGRTKGLMRSKGMLDLPVLEIGSTLIRNRLAAGRDVSLLVPGPVLSVICKSRLYRS